MSIRPVIGISMNYMQLGSYHQFHVRNKYIDAVYNYGGLPLPIPCLTDESCLIQYLRKIQAVIIIGGLDYPPAMYEQEVHPKTELMDIRRATSDQMLFHLAKDMGLPMLGICAGMQLMNIATGGKLIQHLETVDYHFGEKYHPIHVTGGKWLPKIFNESTLIVNSNHHQGLDPDYLGKGFIPVAHTDDGVIEAIEYDSSQFILGIQWHPERITNLEHQSRFFNFLIHSTTA